MATNSANARIWGSEIDEVFCAPFGTPRPLTRDEVPAKEWETFGWLGEDGVPFTPDDSATEHNGHQGGGLIRVKMDKSTTSFKFKSRERKRLTHGLQWTVKEEQTDAQGETIYRLSSARQVETRGFLIDLYDVVPASIVPSGMIHDRYWIPNGQIVERAELANSNKDITDYEFTVKIIGDVFMLTNDPALAVPVTP